MSSGAFWRSPSIVTTTSPRARTRPACIAGCWPKFRLKRTARTRASNSRRRSIRLQVSSVEPASTKISSNVPGPGPSAAVDRPHSSARDRALYGLVFVCFVLFQKPGLGLGHFFYVPVVLIGLALGMRAGVVGGVLASGLYALAIVVTPRLPVRDVLTVATAIRLVTYGT